MASWYGEPFHGRATANGEVFDRDGLTAAHPTLPLPSIVRVTNLANGRQIDLRVNDRGPFVDDRLIDLSQARGARARLRAPGPRAGARRVRRPRRRQGRAAAAGPAWRRCRSRAAAGPAWCRPHVGRRRVCLVHRRGRAAAGSRAESRVAAPAGQCGGRFIQIGAFAEPARAWPRGGAAAEAGRRAGQHAAAGQRSADAGPGRADRRSAARRRRRWISSSRAAMPAPSSSAATAARDASC